MECLDHIKGVAGALLTLAEGLHDLIAERLHQV